MEKNRAINVGDLIRHARMKKNYSLRDLENITGISSSYIMRLEKGERRCPTIVVFKKLIEALDLDMLQLLEMDEEQNSGKKRTISTLLLGNDFSIAGDLANRETKELLVALIEKIISAKWSENTKLRDLYEIMQKVEELKAKLA